MLFFPYNDILWYESFTSCLFRFPILIPVELADDISGNFFINFTGKTLDETLCAFVFIHDGPIKQKKSYSAHL